MDGSGAKPVWFQIGEKVGNMRLALAGFKERSRHGYQHRGNTMNCREVMGTLRSRTCRILGREMCGRW